MKYKVLKEYVHPRTEVLIKPGYEFEYESKYITPYMKALEQNNFIEEIPEQPKTAWDLEDGDIFYIIGGGIVGGGWWNSLNYTLNRAAGDVFRTKAEAEKELARRKAKAILERDTKGFKPKIGDVSWEVYYNPDTKTLNSCGTSKINGSLRFYRISDAEASILIHKNEWEIYLGVEE